MEGFLVRNRPSRERSQSESEDIDGELDEQPLTPITPSSSTSATLPSIGSNPRPYLEKYFSFISVKGNTVEYKCKTCSPKVKIISCNRKSLHNIKLHMKRVHSQISNEFNECVTMGVRERKRNRSSDSGAAETPKKRLQSIDVALSNANKVVTQDNIDKKIVALFVENMLSLEVSKSAG